MINPENVSNSQPTEEFNFDPSDIFEAAPAEEPEQVLDADSAEEDEPQEPDDGSDDEPEPLAAQEEETPRVQKRIRQLASEKNAAKEEAKVLESKNAELQALVEQLKKSNDIQSQMQERQRTYWEAQDQLTQRQQREQLMRQYGLDPNDQKDAIAYENIAYKAELEQELNNLKKQLEEQKQVAQFERFNQALDSSLTKTLKDYNVDPDIMADIRETAFDYADLKGATASEAAQAAVKRYQRLLTKKKTVKAANVDAAAKAVTMSNRSKGKAPGKQAGEDADFLSMLDAGSIFQGR